MIEELIRPRLRGFSPYVSARSGSVAGRIFLDANELSTEHPASFRGIALNRYPDPNQLRLRAELAGRIGVTPDEIFIGAGSDEIIDLLFRLFCEPSIDNVAILDPTYGVYRVAAELNGVRARAVELDNSFQIDVDNTLGSVDSNTKLLFCCSPNNPTGNLLRRDDVFAISRVFNGLVVMDEAYVEFSGAESLARDVASIGNLVVLRTFSKARGLAGIRLGYCIASPVVVDYLLRIKSPYNVCALASDYALRSLEMDEEIRENVRVVVVEREQLASAMRRLPSIQHVYPSAANFLLVRFNDSSRAYSALLDRGIVVRRRSEPRLQNCLRITVGTSRENDLLLKVLSELEP